MSKLLIRVALMALLIGLGISARAKEEYDGFVKDPYYLIKGGKEVSPKDFAANPLKYMRSPAAYTALRDHAAQVVGRPMSDQAFRQLIVSEDVKVVECVGRIKTQGIAADGRVGWHERACYPGERKLRVRVPGGETDLLSLGCYNPVEGDRPIPPVVQVPVPVAGACGSNAKRYSFTDTNWPTQGNFCAVGEQSPSNISFPEAGSATQWSCPGQGGGSSIMCPASRAEAPAPVAKKEPKEEENCQLVEWSEVIPPPPTYANVPPLTVSVCGRYIMSAGGTWRIINDTRHISTSAISICR